MGAFGDAISALLDVYSSCLKLVRAFQRSQASEADLGSSEANRLLQDAIRSDRARVRNTYSSRLTQDGRKIKHGDCKLPSPRKRIELSAEAAARSRGALRRTVHRLQSVIQSLVKGPGGTQPAKLDYEALTALSNSSRIEAIWAVERLSSRSGGSSSGSISSRKHSSRERTIGERKNKGVGRRSPHRKSEANAARQPSRRASTTTSSSGSTRLGEMEHRMRRSRSKLKATNDYEYPSSIRPAYPLHAYNRPAEEKGGLLKRMFGIKERRF